MKARGQPVEAPVSVLSHVRSPDALSLVSLLPLNPSYFSVYPMLAQSGATGPSQEGWETPRASVASVRGESFDTWFYKYGHLIF